MISFSCDACFLLVNEIPWLVMNVFIDVCSDGCITKAPSDALCSLLASQSVNRLGDWSATSAVDLGSYFTLGVKSQEDVPVTSPVPLSARTPRPSSSRARVSNQSMSRVLHTETFHNVSAYLPCSRWFKVIP